MKGVEATTQSAPPKEEAKPTGEASKGPEAKTDGGTAKSDAQPDQANGWTKDEDTTLLELKTQKNISWAEVATKLGKSDKEDVKQRFRELKGTGEAKEANAKVDQGKKKDAKALAKTVEAENSRHATGMLEIRKQSSTDAAPRPRQARTLFRNHEHVWSLVARAQ